MVMNEEQTFSKNDYETPDDSFQFKSYFGTCSVEQNTALSSFADSLRCKDLVRVAELMQEVSKLVMDIRSRAESGEDPLVLLEQMHESPGVGSREEWCWALEKGQAESYNVESVCFEDKGESREHLEFKLDSSGKICYAAYLSGSSCETDKSCLIRFSPSASGTELILEGNSGRDSSQLSADIASSFWGEDSKQTIPSLTEEDTQGSLLLNWLKGVLPKTVLQDDYPFPKNREDALASRGGDISEAGNALPQEQDGQPLGKEIIKRLICLSCNTSNHNEHSKFCRQCGQRLKEEQFQRCSSCKKEIQAQAQFCRYCGLKVGAAIEQK